MAKKPFEIQNSTLIVGGVELQAGATTIVIPGVTQATNYTVVEVNEVDDQTTQWDPGLTLYILDAAELGRLNGDTRSGSYVAAEYTATVDDDGEIDDIEVSAVGTFSSGDKTVAEANMWASQAVNAIDNFNINDWTEIPFQPVLRPDDVSNVSSGGIVQRTVEFPYGEEGDTRGTIALTPDGETYICTDNYENLTPQYQTSYAVVNTENYDVIQSGNTLNFISVLAADEPELTFIMNNGTWNGSDWTIDAGGAYGGAQTCSNVSWNGTKIYFQWPYRDGDDPTTNSIGDQATVVYSGTITQQPIWRRLVDVTASANSQGDGQFTWTSEGDLTIETVRPDGYTDDCDLNLYAADDIWMEANGDQIEIKAQTQIELVSNTSYVRLEANNDVSSHWWTFDTDGSLKLPYHNNTGYEPFYSLNGPTLKLGGENDPSEQIIITGPTPNQANPSAQRMVIQGQKGFGGNSTAGEGGDVYIWGGTGGEYTDGAVTGGDGGDIKLRGGGGQFGGNGGYVKIEGGDTFYGPGGTGGYIEISGGDGQGGGNTDGGNVTIRGGRKQGTGNNGEVFVYTGATSEFEWKFDNGGTLHLPTSGDIVDSNGTSVLGGGGGAPTIANTVKGWYQLQGRRPNDFDEVAFQSVTATASTIYTVGKNYYAQNTYEDDSPVVQKIEKSTGNVVWSKRIIAGYNASFNITIASGVVDITSISNAGTGYKAGEELIIPGWALGGSAPTGNIIITVDTVDVLGSIQTASITTPPSIPGSDGSYTGVGVYNNNNSRWGNSIAYDTVGEQLVVACTTDRGAWSQEDSSIVYGEIFVLDETSGNVIQSYTLTDLADVVIRSLAINPASGQIAVVGEKNNEYRSFGTLSMLATGNGYFDILKSNLDPEHFPDSGLPGDENYNFYIQGTGIVYQEGVDDVNYYPGLSTTTREGSGASFDIADNGDGTYGFSAIVNGGADYLVGHKIKILGTALGGTTPANDCVVTVTSASSGIISGVSLSGTAAGGSFVLYSGVTGTNYQVGSGAVATLDISPINGLITQLGYSAIGSNYVAGDVLTISGTVFANGASPANDITITVTAVGVGGFIQTSTSSGTATSDALRIKVDGIDFTVGGGSWSMRQTLGAEAFIWTPTWNKAIGGAVGDAFNGVAFSTDGNSIYAVGRGRYEVIYDQALVVKFAASNGAIQWSKYVNSYLTLGSEVSAEAMSVVTLSNGNIVVATGGHNNPDTNFEEHTLVCLDASGTLVWAKSYTEPNFNFGNECKVVRDGNDDLFLVYQTYSGNNNDAYAIIKIDGSDGNDLWARGLSNGGNGMYFTYNNGNDFAVLSGTDIIIAGYTYIPNDNYYSGLLVKFPQDGFKNFGAPDYANGEQFGDLRLYDLTLNVYSQTQAPPTFDPTIQVGGITNALNDKEFVTVTDTNHPWTILVKMTRDDLGYLEFGDGSTQSFATDKIPQILGSNGQFLKLSPQDSGKHFFFDQNCGFGGIVIPPYDLEDPFPVGFTVTIVNLSGSDIYVNMDAADNNNYWNGAIKGAGRNISTRFWGVPDSGSGSMVTLMKVKNAQYTGGENESGPIWMIAGPSDLYNND